MFSPEERQRYARHLDLPGFGGRAQERLRRGRVFVAGCGGLGSPALAYLAAAGVGTIGFCDGDIVSLSNLQRQILHATTDIGRPKVDSAVARLRALNPHVDLAPLAEPLTEANAAVLDPYDFVVDATDSFSSKALLAALCARRSKPCVFAALDAFSAQLLTVIPGSTPCLRCLFPELPADAPARVACRENTAPEPPNEFREARRRREDAVNPASSDGNAASRNSDKAVGMDFPDKPLGPLSPIPGVIGSLQALEAIKYLSGIGTLHTGALLLFDALTTAFSSIALARNPACPLCGNPETKGTTP